MSTNRDQFVIDESGNKTGVLVDIDRYSELIEAAEELESIRAFDEAKASNDEEIPLGQAINEIEGAIVGLRSLHPSSRTETTREPANIITHAFEI